MTYRELIEICYRTPEDECGTCSHERECRVFRDTIGDCPLILYKALGVDFDAEIEVIE